MPMAIVYSEAVPQITGGCVSGQFWVPRAKLAQGNQKARGQSVPQGTGKPMFTVCSERSLVRASRHSLV